MGKKKWRENEILVILWILVFFLATRCNFPFLFLAINFHFVFLFGPLLLQLKTLVQRSRKTFCPFQLATLSLKFLFFFLFLLTFTFTFSYIDIKNKLINLPRNYPFSHNNGPRTSVYLLFVKYLKLNKCRNSCWISQWVRLGKWFLFCQHLMMMFGFCLYGGRIKWNDSLFDYKMPKKSLFFSFLVAFGFSTYQWWCHLVRAHQLVH